MTRKKGTRTKPPPGSAFVLASGRLSARETRLLEEGRRAKRAREKKERIPSVSDVNDKQDVKLDLRLDEGPGPRIEVAVNFLELYDSVLLCIKGLESGVSGAMAKSLNGLSKFACQAEEREAVLLCRRPGILEALSYVMQHWRVRKRTYCMDSFQTHKVDRWADEEEIHQSWESCEEELVWCEDVFSKRSHEKDFDSSYQSFGICASSILKNLSLHKFTGSVFAENRYVLSVAVYCIEDMAIEAEELVENAAEILLSASSTLDMSKWKIPPGTRREDIVPYASQDRLLRALDMLLRSNREDQNALGCKILAKLALTPANEEWLVGFGAHIAPRLVELLGEGNRASRAAAVDAIHSFTQSDSTSCARFARCTGCFSALINALSAATSVFDELGWKAALVLEHLASEPRNKEIVGTYEGEIATIAMSKTWAADVAASTLMGICLGQNLRKK